MNINCKDKELRRLVGNDIKTLDQKSMTNWNEILKLNSKIDRLLCYLKLEDVYTNSYVIRKRKSMEKE
jgi:ABC-type glutathione transport system ATPase component